MRIFVNARFLCQPLSGVQRYAIECSRQIKKLYSDTIFIAPGNIIHHDIAAELNVRTIGKRTGHKWEQIDLPGYLAGEGTPPLLCLSNTGPLWYANTFLTLHDLAFYHHPEWNSRAFSMWYNFMVPRLVKKCRHVFTVSNTVKNEIIDSYKVNGDKISVTYNGISASMLRTGGQSDVKKEKIILSVGTFNLRKNHHMLIRAFMESDLRHTYKLAMVGDKNKVFREAGIDESTMNAGNINIYNHVGEQELIHLYQKAELLTSLSLYEGFGIPLVEGLYFGCKVVCSDIPVYRELFNGYVAYCDPLNTVAVRKALEEAADNTQVPDFSRSPLAEKYSYAAAARVIVDQITSMRNS